VIEEIGPYRIVRVLGQGGMGVVYEAWQTEPVRRRVALKLIRGDLPTVDVIRRFEAERQALAVMEHPNIAKVLDAGSTSAGQPYFVMEYVDGLPITEYADRHRLTTEDRLRLFITVCEAIQHAHQKGVIHRDLKPSNILVVDDSGGSPRVIDFGVAKAMGVKLTDRTLATEYGALVGTPAYMSPEQAEGTGLDVDTRSDIYALGVVLYELLVGRLPVDPEDLGLIPFLAQLMAGGTNPPTPSGRVSTLSDEAVDVSRRRRTSPRELSRRLSGDLDWIVMKAMAHERERRYETANGLALDLRRYLRNELVLARPPTTRYRMGKFVRRNRTGVLAGAIAVVLLIVGTFTTAIGMVRARRAEARAVDEAATAAQVAAFMESLFQGTDPSRTLGQEVTLGDVLDDGAARIREELAGQPVVQARLMNVIVRAYDYLGRPKDAFRLSEQRLDVLEEAYGPDDPRVAVGHMVVGFMVPGYENKRTHFERALEIWEADRSPQRRGGIAGAATLLTIAYEAADRFEEAEALGRRAVALLEDYPEPDRERWEMGDRTPHEVLLAAYINLGVTLADQLKYEEALPLQQRSLVIAEQVLGPEHPDLSRHLLNTGGYLLALGRFDEAGTVLERGLEQRERLRPTRDGISRMLLVDLGVVRSHEGRFREADSLIAVARSVYDESSLVEFQGRIRLERAEPEAAERYFREALAAQEQRVGSDDRSLGPPLTDLGWALLEQNRLREAHAACERAVALYEATELSLIESSYSFAGLARERASGYSARATTCLAAVRVAEEDEAGAEVLFERALALQEALFAESPALGMRRQDLIDTLQRYADLMRASGRLEEARLLEARRAEITT